MVKPEWGTKRTCPKCSTRFYDLGKEDPVHCIECGAEWAPEPVLKSKQPLAFEVPVEQKEAATADADLEAEDLAIVQAEFRLRCFFCRDDLGPFVGVVAINHQLILNPQLFFDDRRIPIFERRFEHEEFVG